MSSDAAGKRQSDGGGDLRKRKRQRYKQHSSTTTRRDLGKGARGFLISCTPKHEVQCFRDALVLLNHHIDVDALVAHPPPATAKGAAIADAAAAAAAPKLQVELPPQAGPDAVAPIAPAADLRDGAGDAAADAKGNAAAEGASPQAAQGGAGAADAPVVQATKAADVSAALSAELGALKRPEQSVFTRVDVNVHGSIFVRVDDARVDLEAVAESILQRAQTTQSPGCRFCIKIIPVHTTCYAKARDAAAAAVGVVAHAFPDGKATYAIQFKARMNSGAHRDDYIKAIADAIDKEFPQRFAVNLTKPDVVLIVEVMKTSCCIGTFRRYFELGKMNVREACKPKKEPAAQQKKDGASVNKDANGVDVENPTDSVITAEKNSVVNQKEKVVPEENAAPEEKTAIKEKATPEEKAAPEEKATSEDKAPQPLDPSNAIGEKPAEEE